MGRPAEGDIGGEGTGTVDLSWGRTTVRRCANRMASILERRMGAEGIIHI